MCSKSHHKAKSSSSRSSSSSSHSKTQKKCSECRTRRIARDEVQNIFSPPVVSNPFGPPLVPAAANMSRAQYVGHDATYDYSQGYGLAPGYGYGWNGYDGPFWDDMNPVTITRGQWRDHAQTVKNVYKASEENGKLIGEMKTVITSEIKEVRDAIKEARDSVQNTDSHVKEALAAIKETKNIVGENHTAQTNKQQEYAADIARARQLLEAEAKQHEEARRMQEMVQYAQSQGLLLQQSQSDRDSGSRNSPRSGSSRTASVSPTRSQPRQHSSQSAEERERERVRFEQLQLIQQAHMAETMREVAANQQRVQEAYERWWRQQQHPVHQEIDNGGEQYARSHKRREHRRSRHTPPPPPAQTESVYYEDDVIEVTPYSAYSYAEYGVGGGTTNLVYVDLIFTTTNDDNIVFFFVVVVINVIFLVFILEYFTGYPTGSIPVTYVTLTTTSAQPTSGYPTSSAPAGSATPSTGGAGSLTAQSGLIMAVMAMGAMVLA
ncbi:hypothetical protein F5Y17DRAFT_470959 [Xylariaceae sp. FL0594]|nr:hypothetical protein F5Y17DRAFT_470959 [Xylariaceae sp. FL0594]